jgi:hypothetical protein
MEKKTEMILGDQKAPLKRGVLYPVHFSDSRVPSSELPHGLRYDASGVLKGKEGYPVFVFARYNGVKRAPKKGEYYLSGALIEGYRAPNDLSTPYHIAELVFVKKVTYEVAYEVS